jgi:hypothetical protein
MPVHDWTRVEAGLFHDFHHEWISTIKSALNNGLLPPDYYALAEQVAGGLIPDVLTLQGANPPVDPAANGPHAPASLGAGGTQTLLAPPTVAPTAETDLAVYRKKQNVVAVRHVSGDRVVAIIEIVSLANKASPNPLQSFVKKAIEFLDRDIHLLILDLYPPGDNDPLGMHGAIWYELSGKLPDPPTKPLTFASYEATGSIRAYVKYAAVGDVLPDMPLFLLPNAQVPLPLEATYTRAFANVPRRIRERLERPGE